MEKSLVTDVVLVYAQKMPCQEGNIPSNRLLDPLSVGSLGISLILVPLRASGAWSGSAGDSHFHFFSIPLRGLAYNSRIVVTRLGRRPLLAVWPGCQTSLRPSRPHATESCFCCFMCIFNAPERTRTSNPLREHGPKPCAYANSATGA